MGRIGFGSGRAARRGGGRGALRLPPLAAITPSAAWTGAPGSGFAAVPADPPRTTAKPVCRLIVPPLQWFTGELLIGVYAGANNRGSLIETMGLERVICHCEGNRIDIPAPSHRTIVDANGVPRSYFGWWIKLAHDGRHGHARVYFEAVPRDPAIQRRVIGPFQFSPQPQVHDVQVTIAASQPPIAGQRFQTMRAALDHLRTVAAKNPLVTFIEAGSYVLRGPTVSWQNTGGGRVTFAASAPVTLVRDPADPITYFRPQLEPVCFRGARLTIDFGDATEYYFEPSWAGTSANWFDGCRLICSPGTNALFKKAPRIFTGQTLRGAPWFTEVDWRDVSNPAIGAALVRGGTALGGFSDIVNGCGAVLGFTAAQSDATWYRTPVPAMTVRYTGPAGAAVLSASGTSTRTFTAKVDGVVAGTYQVNSSLASHDANANYHVHNVVDWLNGAIPGTTGGTLAGWSATLLDDSRVAYALYPPGPQLLPGATGWSLDCKAGAATLATAFDIHADFAQTYSVENVVLADSANLRCPAIQQLFLKDGPVRDALIVNNTFDNVAGEALLSQFADVHSHVVCAHNSWSTQSMMFRTDLTGGSPNARYQPDGYCLFANNAVAATGFVGAAVALPIRNNHWQAGATDPAGATGSSAGGTAASLFADPPAGDFAPRGELLASPKPAVVLSDRLGRKRRALAPAGAVAG